MATKIPAVFYDGLPAQLQAGDTLATVAQPDISTLVNANAAQAVIGTPVYSSAAGSYDFARANTLATAKVIGLVRETTAAGASGTVQTGGTFTATTAQWDAVTGLTGGLTFNAYYFLSPTTAGRLTATAPTANPDYATLVLHATSTTDAQIFIQPPIRL